MGQKGEKSYLSTGVDVADVSGNTRRSRDIVKRERGDERVELHEESEGLADAAGGAEDRHLPGRSRVRREGPGCRGGASLEKGSEKDGAHFGVGRGTGEEKTRWGWREPRSL